MKPILLKTRFASSSSFIDSTCGSLAVFRSCFPVTFFHLQTLNCAALIHMQNKMEPTADHSEWYWVCFSFLNDQNTQ